MEKRKFMRFDLRLEGEFLPAKDTSSSLDMQMIDFSRAGLRLAIPKDNFPESRLLSLKLRLPTRYHPIFIQGGVKWVRPAGNDYELGLKIEEINPVDKNEILNYAYNLWREKKIN